MTDFVPVMRAPLSLDTMKDIREFVKIVQDYDKYKIYVTDGKNLRVNAKSVIGVLYSLEFDNLWIESEIDIYSRISDFIKE